MKRLNPFAFYHFANPRQTNCRGERMDFGAFGPAIEDSSPKLHWYRYGLW
jgi:hypothetical protein